MPLVLVFLPFLEIYVFIQVGDAYGYFHAVMAIIASFFLGLLVVQSQGRAFLVRAQSELMRGELPAKAVVHSLMVFLGGILLMIPGFITDALGLMLIIPGVRHILAIWVRRYLAQQIQLGKVHLFKQAGRFGFGSGNFSAAGQRPQSRFQSDSQFETTEPRDVTPKVIDVTPLPPRDKKDN